MAATHAVSKAKDTRRVEITRRYEIPVTKGAENVAGIPALMSFWGATNQQVILKSDFTYGVKPDKIEITADNRGMFRRNYELTWTSPQVDKISVTQKLLVQLTSTHTLLTAAKLPYPNYVATFFSSLLGKDKRINPENLKLDPICKGILSKAVFAEQAVELACDWVNENVPFQSGASGDSDTILASRRGNCVGLSNLACAILRRMGVPAEPVQGIFIGSGGGHEYIEAYFPDAGWVFYDLSNSNRGFKCLDCLMTVGFAFRTFDGKNFNWHSGRFCKAKDVARYAGDPRVSRTKLRPGPKGKTVVGARFIPRKPPPTLKVRHLPLSRLIMDTSIPPGVRKYKRIDIKAAATQPGAGPSRATKPARSGVR